jgi:peptidoglycan/xylan/chitin deacetylase (PgdA/CDA1 family)
MSGEDVMRGVGPSLPYPVKAAVTRARSAAWLARGRGGGGGPGHGLRILFYHRVAADGDELAVHPRRFREQMEYLARNGYRVVDVLELADLLDGGEVSGSEPLTPGERPGELPPRTIGLNFDDGYLDVAEHALPVLEELGFRATVFVATGVTDGRTSFAWYEGRQPPVLSWEQIRHLDARGTLRFEAHTVSHPNLLAVDDKAAEREIVESKRELESQLGREVSAFSYPAGLFGERERRLVVAAGYRVAVGCEPGVNLPETDRHALRRRQIDARDRMLDFRAKVTGGHDTPLPFRGAYRRLRYGEGAARPRLASSRR